MDEHETSSKCLDEVRRMAARLKLDPRRPSILLWKAENEGGAFAARTVQKDFDSEGDASKHRDARPSANRFADVGDAIEWIKKELMSLREQDYTLARQLISLRNEMVEAKLKRSCSEHRALLEDATMEMQLQHMDDDILCDLESEVGGRCPQPLRGIGITRMNLCSRRFSLS